MKKLFTLFAFVLSSVFVLAVDPDVPTITGPADTINDCPPGGVTTITWTGNLNDATEWIIYTDGCGTTFFDNSPIPALAILAPSVTTTFYIRGEGGGVTPGACASITFRVDSTESEISSVSASVNPICAGENTDLTANGVTLGSGATLEWYDGPGGTGTMLGTSNPITVNPSVNTTYYARLDGFCNTVEEDIDITITTQDDPTFNYSASSYCVNSSDPTPTTTTPGGTFSATPVGLSINAGTGEIDVSASTIGSYTVKYVTGGACPDSTTATIDIDGSDDPSFSYSAASYCSNESDPTPTVTGTAGGTYSFAPAGLVINASTGEIDLDASTATTYAVQYLTPGPDCPDSTVVFVTINAADDPSFSYASNVYCQDGSDPTPTVTGVGGGTFTATPAGMTINPATGEIDVSASTANIYTVQYLTPGICPDSTTFSLEIKENDDPSFSYSAASYCTNGTDPTPTVTGVAGGTFSSTPAGLSINAGTGEIDLSTSSANTYTVQYVTPGPDCPDSTTTTVEIKTADDPSFTYASNVYCQDGSDPTPTVTGTAGGTFSATPAGLSITAGTGLIDVSASTANTYTVQYLTPGPDCPDSTTFSVEIKENDDPTFSYSAASYCTNDTDPTPTVTGTAGGTFSATPAGLVITAGTGEIDVSASAANTYTVQYVTPGPDCPDSTTTTVEIKTADDPAFSYSAASYCSDESDPTPTVTGTAGGTFSATPAGLSITAGTGLIDVSASTAGSYTVKYVTPGPDCPDSSTVTVDIVDRQDPTFNYSATSYCQNGTDPTPTVTVPGGTFTSINPGLVINASTGEIDLSASTANSYAIQYVTPGPCPDSTVSPIITILAQDDPSFTYASNVYCQDGSDPTPTITGVGGGTFSATPAGLNINAGTGEIDVSASTANTYTVQYLTPGSCPDSTTFSVEIKEDDDPTFSYGAASYCTNDTDPTPTITGTAGGTFSATPAGLSINAGTGEIDVSASTANTYTVQYLTPGPDCPDSTTTTVEIKAADDPAFSYSAASYCLSEADPTPTVTGTAGGTFSATPAGLSITAGTGEIDVSASLVNTYTVKYVTPGPDCPDSSTVIVDIVSLEDPSFTYASSVFCTGDADPTPTVTGLAGGTFSATPAGLTINAGTGEITIGTSTANTYTVQYLTPGLTCPDSTTFAVTIDNAQDATFSYSASTYCSDEADPTPTVTGTAGGTFSATPAGLSITAGTGEIDLDASTANTYTIKYVTPGPNCIDSSTVTIDIMEREDPTFSYASATYCENGTDPTPTVTTAGGTFSATPAGLSINASTGEIDLDASSVGGPYTIKYVTPGFCADSSSAVTITINAGEDASFSYAANSYCQIEADPTPTITGTAGGTFSATPAGLSINAGTGEIDLSLSTAGTYTIQYLTPGGFCPDSNDFVLDVVDREDPSFTYSSANYCSGDADPIPTVTGLSGGTYSYTSTGGDVLSLNTTTGEIDLSASDTGTYTVQYLTPGSVCPDSTTFAVTIDAEEDATFSYALSAYCQSGSDPTPTITGTAGGTFSATPVGLVINSGTGEIDVAGSTIGSYTVQYLTPGANCADSTTVTVDITAGDVANLTYSASVYCQNEANPLPLTVGTPGGVFLPVSGTGIAGDGLTGEIFLATSAPGTYEIEYTTPGGAACEDRDTVTITINAADTAAFSYALSAYCQSGSNATPTITGTTGGTFSSGAGLMINAGTGEIDVAGSTVGSYTVQYLTPGVTCPDSTTVTVDITAGDDATFSYSASNYCSDETDPVPTITETGGTFSVVSGVGLIINTSTGEIDLDASAAGTYDIQYKTGGAAACADSTIETVTIDAAEDATFSYALSAYCQVGSNPTPTITGTTGGTFTATPAGLVINGGTGEIDVAGSTIGSYTVQYLTPGVTCPDSTTVTVDITAGDDATFSYSASIYCSDESDPVATIAEPGGVFNVIVGTGLVIDTLTGEIDLDGSAAGSYDIEYVTGGDPACEDRDTVTVTIDAAEDAAFSYALSAYCQVGSNPTPTITGTTGGTFSSGAGLVINAGTGEIDVAGSTLGSYTVKYVTPGANCPDSTTVTVDITAGDDATFSYSASTYCSDETDPVATIAEPGGVFNVIVGTGLVIDTLTGEIDLDGSVAGTYDIEYVTGGDPACEDRDTVTVTINTADTAAFSYALSAYCQAGGNALPTITGTTGGTFSSGAGLMINAGTGEIDVAGSTLGSYTVKYVTPGATCPDSTTVTVDITLGDDATFSYSALTYCSNETDPVPTIAETGGVFSVIVGTGLVIDTLTGEIDLDGSVAGTYDIEYVTGGDPACEDRDTVTVTINTAEDATFSYDFASYCQGGSDATPTISGTTGGAFSATPVGLSIDPVSGVVTVGTSTAGSYMVRYVTGGATCPDTLDVALSITLTDTVAPSIACPANDTVAGDAACQISLADYTSSAVTTDNCDAAPVVTQSPAAGTTVSGTTEVWLYSTDVSGNVDSCSFDVTVIDNTAPSITCLSGDTIAADAVCDARMPDYTNLVVTTDNCDSAPVVTQSPAFGTTISGTTTVTLYSTDASGNVDSCSFNVLVADSTAPTVTCPADDALFADNNCGAVLPDYTGSAVVADNCDSAPVVTQSPAAGTTITSTTVVTLTATDANGNAGTCTFNVSVNDTIAPTLVCTDQTQLLDNNCQATLDDYTLTTTVTDNCDANPIITQSPAAGTLYTGKNIVPVTLIAEDASGNIDSCTFDVTIEAGQFNDACIDDLFIANMLTPNGDGKNDTWIIRDLSYVAGCDVIVYDRWNNKVFESNDYQNDWDGTFNGKEVADATYYYVIVCDGETKYSGTLKLLRLKK